MKTIYIASRDSGLRGILTKWLTRRIADKGDTPYIVSYHPTEAFFREVMAENPPTDTSRNPSVLIVDMRHLNPVRIASAMKLLQTKGARWCVVIVSPPEGFLDESTQDLPAYVGTIDDDQPDYGIIEKALTESDRIVGSL